ncbi:MAG TPA: hypothetical protein VMB21_06620, partial [Candidatus Limnocylindria bacterium]|nr:hypothetical protein [Candidatus Limnocylindria bacterium]
LAGVLTWRFLHESDGISEKAFYYDLSEQKLFVAERGRIPPIRGINDATEDGVRAVVISRSGKPEDQASREIAYLETCSPELKQQMEAAKATGTSPAMGRTAAQAHRLVKRVKDAEWVSLATPEGERIVAEWTLGAPDGSTPVVCSP